jgi:hypothetical protein
MEPLSETLKTIQGFYDDLVAAPRMAAKFGDTDSPFYGREVTPKNIWMGFEFGLEGFSIYLWPRFDQIDYYDESYEFGGGQFVAIVEDVGGPPAYAEMKKVVDYLSSPIRDKVGNIDYEPVKQFWFLSFHFIVAFCPAHSPAFYR